MWSKIVGLGSAAMTVGGGQGGGRLGKRGEVYGRREKRGREAGFARWREVGEKGKNGLMENSTRHRAE